MAIDFPGIAAVIAAVTPLFSAALTAWVIIRQGRAATLASATHDLVNGMSKENRTQAGQIGYDAGVAGKDNPPVR